MTRYVENEKGDQLSGSNSKIKTKLKQTHAHAVDKRRDTEIRCGTDVA